MNQTAWIGYRFLIVLAMFATVGCGNSTSKKPPLVALRSEREALPEEKPKADQKPSVLRPADEESQQSSSAEPKPTPDPSVANPTAPVSPEPAKLAMPKVVLSDTHAKTCLVGVGDQMPTIQLKDLAGKSQSLEKLLGKKLTVVTFWSGSSRYSLEELTDLGPDILKPFGDHGVAVVTINERDKPDAVQKTIKQLGARFPTLLDADGKALSTVATRRLPRTYLLDSSGKILWFDIEYSRSTRRELLEAIRFTLDPS